MNYARVYLFILEYFCFSVAQTDKIFDRTILVGGCVLGKGLRPVERDVRLNIKRLTSIWLDYRVCVYADDEAAALLSAWNDTRLEIIWQSKFHVNSHRANSPYRTERLAIGRNACLNLFRGMLQKNATQTDEETLFISMDLDDVNRSPFKTEVIKAAVAEVSQWDVLTFNRVAYYDYWALRNEKYDKNIMVHGGRSGWWEFTVHKEFGEAVLDKSALLWFPVYSAFDGLAIYKLNFTRHCQYDGEHPWKDGKNHTVYVEECEHVNFQKCMTEKNGARVFIYNRAYLNTSEHYSQQNYQELHKASSVDLN